MFSAVRVAVVVAVVALTSSLAYVAVRHEGPAMAPGAPVDGSDFAGFTGTFSAPPCELGVRTVEDWGRTVEGDYCTSMTSDVSDERMSGAARAIHNGVTFKDGPVYGVRTLSADIVNDGGSWEGIGIAFDDPDDRVMRYELLLSGRGGYEGLSAMLSLVSDASYNHHEAQGVIFPGELPPYPAFDGAEPSFDPADRGEIDPAEFSGYEGEASLSTAGSLSGSSTLGDFGYEARGDHYWDIAVETDDPRMSGMQETYSNTNDFDPGAGKVHTATDRIVTEDGWWDKTTWGYDNPETGTLHYVDQLAGHGAQEGLSAIAFGSQDRWLGPIALDGVIFPGELPPYPEPLPAE